MAETTKIQPSDKLCIIMSSQDHTDCLSKGNIVSKRCQETMRTNIFQEQYSIPCLTSHTDRTVEISLPKDVIHDLTPEVSVAGAAPDNVEIVETAVNSESKVLASPFFENNKVTKGLQERCKKQETQLVKQSRDLKTSKNENAKLRVQINILVENQRLGRVLVDNTRIEEQEKAYADLEKHALRLETDKNAIIDDMKSTNQQLRNEFKDSQKKLHGHEQKLIKMQADLTIHKEHSVRFMREKEEEVKKKLNLQKEFQDFKVSTERENAIAVDSNNNILRLERLLVESSTSERALQAQVEVLNTQLHNERFIARGHQNTESIITREINTMVSKYDSLRTRYDSLLRSADKDARDCRRLRSDRNYEMSRNYFRYAKSYVDDLRDEIDEEKTKVRDLQEECDKVKSQVTVKNHDINNLNARIGNSMTTINNLQFSILDKQNEILKLQREQQDKEPLVEIGVAIRTRFLEHSRINPRFGIASREDLMQSTIDKGNSAAHCGNILADLALFKAGLIGDEYETVFNNMYLRAPGSVTQTIGPSSHLFTQVTENCATISAGEGLNSSAYLQEVRPRAFNIVDRIVDTYNEMANNGSLIDFEHDTEVQRLAQELEELKDDIVLSNRQRGRGRR